MTTQDVTRRGALLAGLSALAGCQRPQQDATHTALDCPVLQAGPITHKFLFDCTTAVPPDMVQRMSNFVESLLQPHARLQVLSFGGVTPNLIREEFQIQMPGPRPTSAQREADRWSKAPRDIEMAEKCLARDWAQTQVRPQIEAVTQSADNTPRGRSPIFEAVSIACHGWAGGTLVLWSDGIEHHGPGRSFYGSHGLAVPEPQAWLSRLRADDLLPDLAQRVAVQHLAVGLSEEPGEARRIRQFPETAALKQVWRRYWSAVGAHSLVFGEPLPVQA